jgi:DNA-binding FrmR family transcriptional regulator
MSHLLENSADLLARVRRIAGQVGAVERALQKGAGCSEVLHLVAAVRGAANGLMDEIIARISRNMWRGRGLTMPSARQGPRSCSP